MGTWTGKDTLACLFRQSCLSHQYDSQEGPSPREESIQLISCLKNTLHVIPILNWTNHCPQFKYRCLALCWGGPGSRHQLLLWEVHAVFALPGGGRGGPSSLCCLVPCSAPAPPPPRLRMVPPPRRQAPPRPPLRLPRCPMPTSPSCF